MLAPPSPYFCRAPLPSCSRGEGRCQLQILHMSVGFPVDRTAQRTWAFHLHRSCPPGQSWPNMRNMWNYSHASVFQVQAKSIYPQTLCDIGCNWVFFWRCTSLTRDDAVKPKPSLSCILVKAHHTTGLGRENESSKRLRNPQGKPAAIWEGNSDYRYTRMKAISNIKTNAPSNEMSCRQAQSKP